MSARKDSRSGPEQQLILLSAGTAALRRAAQEQIEQLVEQVNWSLLADQLRIRRLLPLLGPRLVELAGGHAGDEFATTVIQALDPARRQGVFFQLITERVMAALAGVGIRCASLKGPILSQALYGDPGRRPSGDIDLLVAQEQLNDAVAVIRESGYSAPSDHVEESGLPRLHFALTHEGGQLPPVELHWRIHWYERSFAAERLLPPPGELNGDWRPAPIDELTALLLFYARDGFLNLRHATDLGAYWDAFGAGLQTGALDESIRVYPALKQVLLAAATVAEKMVGLPLDRLTEHRAKLGSRGRIAVRLTNPHPHASPPQLYADMGLIDGLLAPPGGFRAFIKRQVIPPREVLHERAQNAQRRQASSALSHSVLVLGRYGLAMTRLFRTTRLFSAARLIAGAITKRDAPKAPPALRIAYLCAQYPAVSHTFVLREVAALRDLGAEIATFSIRRAGSDHLLAHADRVAFESTYAILPPRWTALLAAHLKLAVSAPAAYLSTLALALSLAPAGLRGRLWQFFYFIESVVLWRECHREGIRHIHVHMGNVATDVALLTATIGSKIEPQQPWSWSFTLHGPTEFFDVSHFRLAEKLQRALFVVCISDYTRSQLMALSDPEVWDRLHVIHVGIPIEQFTRADDDDSPPEGDATILFVGRHVPEKGHAVLLEAIALLAERGHNVNLTLAGDGPARPMLERFAEQLGVAGEVSFPGAVGQDDIHALYAGASIFCLPSFAEGVPTVLMEAMAMRLPVISTWITGIPELVSDRHTGLLVSPARPDEIADALELLLSDPSLCDELGSNAREKVLCDFNVQRSAEQLYALFVRKLSPSSL